jgi:hypothetical protein
MAGEKKMERARPLAQQGEMLQAALARWRADERTFVRELSGEM